MKKHLLTLIMAGTTLFLHAQSRMAHQGTNSLSATALQNLTLAKPAGGVCDTISNFLLTYTPTVYLDNGGGYVSGQNSYNDQSKADKYSVPVSGSVVIGGIYLFGAGTSSGTGQTFTANVWDNNGPGGLPNTGLGSQTVTYDTVAANVIAILPTIVEFNPGIAVGDTFYVGVNFGYHVGDTLAIVSSQDGESPVNTAYEQFNTGVWYPFDDATNSWGLTVAHAIFPIVCSPVGTHEILTPSGRLAVFPNPSSNGRFTIAVPGHNLGEPVTMTVYDSKGAVISNSRQTAGADATYSLHLEKALKGIYMLKIETSNGVMTQKITIN